MCLFKNSDKFSKRSFGGIPYTAHGEKIPLPPYSLFLVFSCFYAYFRSGKVKLGLGLPRIRIGRCRVRAPEGARNRKTPQIIFNNPRSSIITGSEKEKKK